MFYHISKADLGTNVIMTPKVPNSCLITEEGDIPRICVCTTIYHCLRALAGIGRRKISVDDIYLEFRSRDTIKGFQTLDGWFFENHDFHSPSVYVSDKQPFLPPRAVDFRANKEHWYLTDTEFTRVGYLNLDSLFSGKIEICETFHTLAASSVRCMDRNILLSK